MSARLRIQEEDFDLSAELAALRANNPRIGALASFVGLVRDMSDGQRIRAMTLEHYPGMTEKALEKILAEAGERWNLDESLVIHRVGRLCPGDQIVLVATASAHREAAFAACEFIMDKLKTQAPFWKKESTPEGEHWVEARDSDEAAANRWTKRPFPP